MTTADGDGGRRGARRREGAQIHPCWSRFLFAESSSSGTSSRRRGHRRASRKTWSLSLRQPFPAFQLHRSRVIMATLRCRPLLQLTLTCVRSSHSIVLNILTTITTLVRHGWPIQNQSQLRAHKPARRASVDEKRAVVSVPHRSGEERFRQVWTREESRTHLCLLGPSFPRLIVVWTDESLAHALAAACDHRRLRGRESAPGRIRGSHDIQVPQNERSGGRARQSKHGAGGARGEPGRAVMSRIAGTSPLKTLLAGCSPFLW